MVYPKFIIEGDRLILSRVTYHSELVEDKSQVKGGGWFDYDIDTNTFTLSGSSHDFGQAKLEDIKKCVDEGKVYGNKHSDHSLTKDHKFTYDTRTEIIKL